MCVLYISTKLAVCPVLPLMVLHFLRAAVVSSTGSVHHPQSRFAVSSTELEFSDASLPIPTHKHTLYYSTAGKYDIKYWFWFPQNVCYWFYSAVSKMRIMWIHCTCLYFCKVLASRVSQASSVDFLLCRPDSLWTRSAGGRLAKLLNWATQKDTEKNFNESVKSCVGFHMFLPFWSERLTRLEFN